MNSPTLVLLYSINSPKCDQLRSLLKDRYLEFFKSINVDNKKIRNMLANSTTLKITTVPCIIEIFPDGNLASYEGEKAFEWVTNFIQVIDGENRQPIASQMPNQFPPHMQMPKIRTPYRKIDDILEEPDVPVPNNISGLQGKINPSIDLQEKQADLSSALRRGPKRTAYRGMVENEGYTGLTSDRDMHLGEINRPSRGDGHNNMRSSLPDIPQDYTDMEIEEKPAPRKYPVKSGNKVKLIEDITPEEEQFEPAPMLDDDDPSGMNVPRDESVSNSRMNDPSGMNDLPRNRNKEKSTSLKNLAASIERARSSEEEQIKSYKQGVVKNQRDLDSNEPINL